MAQFRQFLIPILIVINSISCKGADHRTAGTLQSNSNDSTAILMGVQKFDDYFPLIRGKKIGVVANQTSLVDGVHIVDKLLAENIQIIRVFAPEHGFRGEAGPGDHVFSGTDPKTGLQVVSLYGSHKKPLPADLKNLDFVLFDIQDVGARFYTYISTLHYLMEACAENDVQVIVLDRPNPNGFYIDGPVLDTAFRSFVGMDPVPVVHGLTVGEYAMMVNGEGWLHNAVKCRLKVVAMDNYSHDKLYSLPVRPSPNLPNMNAIYLYPTLCFFEGALISVGRGTDKPFEVAGFPGFKNGNFTFTPEDIPGIIKDPPYEGVKCQAINLSDASGKVIVQKRLMLELLIDMYHAYPDKEKFFNNFFDKLAGTDVLRKQIINGVAADSIRKSWQPQLDGYRKMRLKYLLYPD